MNMIRRIQWRFWPKQLPFEQQLIEKQVAREENELSAAVVESSAVETGLQQLGAALSSATSKASPGGISITADEAKPIFRAVLSAKRLAHLQAEHLRTLAS